MHIQDQLFDPETGTALYERVAEDYETLSALFGSDRTLQIYVIPETTTGAILTENETIYCTPEDITEGAYRATLVRAHTDLTEPWKLAGAI